MAIGLALLLAAGEAAAHRDQERVKLDWKRDPKARRIRSMRARRPRLRCRRELAATPAPSQRATQGGVDAEATRAADEMAAEAVRTWGWREYWRAGFARGVGAALDDPRTGAWDHEAGLRWAIGSQVRALGDHFANEGRRRDRRR